ncbi:hypothetical protein M885DRAFT_575447 [Pelagophyceae sp. CCMP2097]|nr:hypothetical protein M885DRAFT_575447 [Pelagophyceae sp. CCMP2097]
MPPARLGLGCLWAAWAARASAAVVRDGLLVDYAFPRSECLAAEFTDAAGALGPLGFDAGAAQCKPGLGVAAHSVAGKTPYASSGGSIAALVDGLAAGQAGGGDGFTIEMWLDVPSLAVQRPLLTLGDAELGMGTIACETTALRLTLNTQNFLEVVMKYDSTDYQFCLPMSTKVAVIQTTAPVHLVVEVGAKLDVYVDGILASSQSYLFGGYSGQRFSAWSQDYVLELFSDGEKEFFDGNLYALRFYNRRLTAAEVSTNYAAKLPNSPPLVYDVAATVDEDGAFGDRGVVTLNIFDADDDPSAPTYNTAAARPEVYVASLPAQGSLFLLDGTPMTSVPTRVPRDSTTGYAVRVKPPRDAFTGDGAFTSLGFSYYAVDGVFGTRSAETASVVVQVAPVNDAPIAAPESTIVKPGVMTIIYLDGTDVDDAGGVAKMTASIVTLPTATLYQVASDGSVGAVVAAGDALQTASVAFLYNGPTAKIDAKTGIFGTDSFTFALTDVHGATSTPAAVSVLLQTPVIAAAGLLVDYAFPRSECLAAEFTDAAGALGPLRFDAAVQCKAGLGVAAHSVAGKTPYASSVGSIATLAQGLATGIAEGADGFTIEMWLDVPSSATGKPILTLGDAELGMSTIACETTALKLTLNAQNFLDFEMKYDSADKKACLPILTTVPVITTTAPVHLVVEVGRNYDVYVDGSLVSSQEYIDRGYTGQRFSAWPQDYVLALFSDGGELFFDGNLYALRFYNRRLTPAEISTNYAAKLPNSPPLVYDVAATVDEDGAFGDRGVVTLVVVDVDDDPSAPNYNVVAGRPQLYIASLPAQGSLYLLDGTPVTSALTRVPRDSSAGYTVRVKPPRDAFTGDGAFTSLGFTYFAVDGVSGTRSAETASVVVQVAPVNDAPIAAPESTVVMAGVKTVLYLDGTDVDDAGGVAKMTASIVSLPTATLYQVASDGSVGAVVAAGDALQTASVAFLYNGPTAKINAKTGIFGSDSFTFAVTDVHGATSTPATVSVVLQTPVTAAATVSQETVEGRLSPILLYGADAADANEPVCFRITALPRHGGLYGGFVLLGVGDSAGGPVPAPYTTGAAVTYVGTPNYFSLPTTTWDGAALTVDADAFGYEAFACSNPGRVSTAVVQKVEVRNVNDKPKLTASTLDFAVYAVGGGSADSEFPDRVELTGLTLDDAGDRDVDAVRVTIRAGKGILTLAKAGDADFNSNAYCFGQPEWQCEKDGVSDRDFTFIATPSEVNLLLKGLSYQSAFSSISDTVTILVYDGIGKNCLAAHKTESVRDKCFASNVTLNVEVGSYSTFAAASSSSSETVLGLPTTFLVGGVVAALVVLCVCGCCVCRARRRCKARRGAKGESVADKQRLDFILRRPSSPLPLRGSFQKMASAFYGGQKVSIKHPSSTRAGDDSTHAASADPFEAYADTAPLKGEGAPVYVSPCASRTFEAFATDIHDGEAPRDKNDTPVYVTPRASLVAAAAAFEEAAFAADAVAEPPPRYGSTAWSPARGASRSPSKTPPRSPARSPSGRIPPPPPLTPPPALHGAPPHFFEPSIQPPAPMTLAPPPRKTPPPPPKTPTAPPAPPPPEAGPPPPPGRDYYDEAPPAPPPPPPRSLSPPPPPPRPLSQPPPPPPRPLSPPRRASRSPPRYHPNEARASANFSRAPATSFEP